MDDRSQENSQVVESSKPIQNKIDELEAKQTTAVSIESNSNEESEPRSKHSDLSNQENGQDKMEEKVHVQIENSSEKIESATTLLESNENFDILTKSTNEAKENENTSWAHQLSLDEKENIENKLNGEKEKNSDSEYEDIDDDDVEGQATIESKNLNEAVKSQSKMAKNSPNALNSKKDTNRESEQKNKEERANNRATVKQQRRIKKEKDPTVIPKKGLFYEHDYRDLEEENEKEIATVDQEQAASVLADNEEIKQEKEIYIEKATNENGSKNLDKAKPIELLNRPSNKRNEIARSNNKNIDDERWAHDRFDLNEQKPKSSQDLIKRYGYDIRKEKSVEAIKQEDNQENSKTQRGQIDKKQLNKIGYSSKRAITKENKAVFNNNNNNNNSRNEKPNYQQPQQFPQNRRLNYDNKRSERERLTKQRSRVYETKRPSEKISNNRQSQSSKSQSSARTTEANVDLHVDEYEDYEDEENEEDNKVKQAALSVNDEEENSDDEAKKLALLRRRKAPIAKVEHSTNKNFDYNQQYRNSQARTNYSSFDTQKDSNRTISQEYNNRAFNSKDNRKNGKLEGSNKINSIENKFRNRNNQFNRQNNKYFYKSDRHANAERNEYSNYDEHDNRESEDFQGNMNRRRNEGVHSYRDQKRDINIVNNNSNPASDALTSKYEQTSHSQIKTRQQQQTNEVYQQQQNHQDFPKRYSSLRSNQTSNSGLLQQKELHTELQLQQQAQTHIQNQFPAKSSSAAASYNFQAQPQFLYQNTTLNNPSRQQLHQRQTLTQQNWHPQTNKSHSNYGHMQRSLVAASQPAPSMIMQPPPGLAPIQHQQNSGMPRHQIYYMPSNEYEYANLAAAVMSNPIYYTATASQSGSISTPPSTPTQTSSQLSPSTIQHLQRQSKAIPIINPNFNKP
jgi:hypothetical protein